jgi:DNA repair exonuclease SbcCD ATPase subunit
MKKLLSLFVLAMLLGGGAYASSPKKDKTDNSDKNQAKEEAKKKKEEDKKLKDELKAYEKNIASYKAFKEQNQATLDSNASQLADLRAKLAAATSQALDLETKVNNDEAQITALQQQAETATAKKAEDGALLPPAQGTYYKVQLGLYKSFNINKYFEQPRTIGYETVDGMNRYIIAYFNDESVAQDFVKDIRKMGIRDAFVSKYIDGTRVYEWSENPKYKGKKIPSTLEEALEMNQKKGGKKSK